MKQQITLRPIEQGNHTVKFTGDYYDKKNRLQVYLLTDRNVVINREPAKGEQVFSNLFSPTNKNYLFDYDDENKTDLVWAEKIKRHSLVRCPGNDNCQRPIFECIDTRKEMTKKVNDIKLKLMAGNMINAMNVSQMRDVAYFKGQDVSRMTSEQIFLTLCDFNTGVLMQDPQQSLDSFDSPDRNVITIVNKAIALDVIKQNNGLYYVGQEQVGKDVAAIVDYCKSNKNLYESFIQREVQKNDRLPIDMNEDGVVEEVVGQDESKPFRHKKAIQTDEQRMEGIYKSEVKKHDVEQFRQAELQSLRDRAKELKIRGWAIPVISKETLERKIKEAEAQLQK